MPTLVRRDPDSAYVEYDLWLPTKHVHVPLIEQALTFFNSRGQADLRLFEHAKSHIIVPRMFVPPYDYSKYAFPFYDLREKHYPHFRITTTYAPRDDYETDTTGVQALTQNEGGILHYSCGRGKSSVALRAWIELESTCLIIVDEKTLMEQWIRDLQGINPITGEYNYIDTATGKPPEVGIVQGKNATWKDKPVSLATIQTLARDVSRWGEDWGRYFRCVIFDEIHIYGAPVFSRGVRMVMGSRWGITATVERSRDHKEGIYLYHIGPVLDTDLTQELIPTVEFHRTGFEINWDNPDEVALVVDKNGDFNASRYFQWLGTLPERNRMIAQDIDADLREGRKILALTMCKEQTYTLASMFPGSGIINGDVDRETRFESLRDCRVIFAIMSCAKKGLNAVELDTLDILTPVQEPGLLQQATGRIQRKSPNKKKTKVRVYEDADRIAAGLCREARHYYRKAGFPQRIVKRS